jgi:outer membrane PBP1 activator LpoA protein
MRKITLIVFIVAVLVMFLSAKDESKISKFCIEPYTEYEYYLNRAKQAKNTDEQTRWQEIADSFHTHYNKCVQGTKLNIINKSNKYQTFQKAK